MEKLKKFLGLGVPGGIDDIVVRSIKTGLAVFLAANPFGSIDATKAAALAGIAAAATGLLNAVILAVKAWVEK